MMIAESSVYAPSVCSSLCFIVEILHVITFKTSLDALLPPFIYELTCFIFDNMYYIYDKAFYI